MFTRLFGTPLLCVGLLATVAACGGNKETDEPTPEPTEEDTHTGVIPDPNRPASLMLRSVFGWDNTAGAAVAFTENGTEITPRIEATLISQYVDPAKEQPTIEDVCFVFIDMSGATVSDWDDTGTLPLTLEVAAGGEITYDCPDWDFSAFDPATVFAQSSWKIGLGASELDTDYYNLLKNGGFFSDTNPEDLYAGAYLEYVDGWIMDKAYARGYEADDNFVLEYDENNALIPIDKYEMPAAPGIVDGVYVVDTHYFWRLQ